MLYIDVDALCKLAHWEILPLLPDILGYDWAEMATISSLEYRARRAVGSPDGRLFRTSVAAQVACAAIAKMGQLQTPPQSLLLELSDSHQIDPGEAVLLAMTASDPKGCLLTGDKRALRALSSLRCSRNYSGRIYIVEQVVERCLEKYGREWVLKHVCPYRDIDKSILVILGSRCDAGVKDIVAGLHSYIKEIYDIINPTFLAGT